MSATTTTDTLTPGTVVRYHGSITTEHWATWIVVVAMTDGRYVLMDREFPTQIMRQVRRASITPTGETLDMCSCGHPVEMFLNGGTYVQEPTVCGVCGWTCANHVKDGDEQ